MLHAIDVLFSVVFIVLNPKILSGLKLSSLTENYKNNMHTINTNHLKLEDRFNHILGVIDREKLYTNSDFSLEELSIRFEMSKNDLDYCFKYILHTKFITYKTQKRIDFAKRSLINGDLNNYSMEGIASRSGFNSRANFFIVFKKETGETPMAFLKKNQIKYQQADVED
jgi:AraC-like DNA-binding protein